MSQELLKKVLPFTESDLEANRRQQVSASQLQRLKREVGSFFQYGIIGVLLSVVLFIVAAIIYSDLENKKPLVRSLDSLPKLLVAFGVFILIVFGVSVFLVLWSSLRSSGYNGRLYVKVTEGKVERFTPGADDYAYTVKVGEMEFYVDEKTHDAFTGEAYRVYFLDASDILSVEEIKPTSAL